MTADVRRPRHVAAKIRDTSSPSIHGGSSRRPFCLRFADLLFSGVGEDLSKISGCFGLLFGRWLAVLPLFCACHACAMCLNSQFQDKFVLLLGLMDAAFRAVWVRALKVMYSVVFLGGWLLFWYFSFP